MITRLVLWALLAVGALAAPPGVREETGTVAVPRGALAYRRWSSGTAGRPLLVYLHGGPGANGSVFRNAAGALVVKRLGDLLLIDQRGCGRSPAAVDPRDFTLERFAEDTRQVLLHLRAPRAVVVGHSFGAAVAVVLARRYPALVEKLVLLSPALDYRDVKYHAYLAMKQRAARAGDRAHLESIRALEREHPAGSESEAELFSRALAGERYGFDARRFAAAEEADLYRILARRDGEPMRVGEHWRRFVAADGLDRKDLLPELPFLAMPVLVIGGAEDFLTPPGSLAKVQALARNARLELMPGAGHHPYLLQPDAFIAHLARFTARD